MTKLLYIKASPRGQASHSAALADAYLAAARRHRPDLAVDVIDLGTERLPEFDGDKAAAKLAIITGQQHTDVQRTAWDEITAIANRFKAADVYLIAAPMWNGSIPYKLKQYIDIVHQPGLLFGLDPAKGYFGLLERKGAVLALTSGAYGPNMPSPAFGTDHHSTYLRSWLNQAGVTDIALLRFQPILLNPDREGAFKAAVTEAEAVAARL